MKDKHDQDQSSQLDEILKELEARFAGDTPTKPSQKKSRKSFFSSFTQSQIIGGLTLVLLVVGASIGLYLGGQNQETRERASFAYPDCTNTSGECAGDAAGSQCTAFTGGPGVCQNSDSDGFCSCVPNQAITPEATATQFPIPACSNDPTCSNPDCGGNTTCVKILCLAIVGQATPFTSCMYGGTEVTMDFCVHQTCGGATETCTSSPPTASACYGNTVGDACTNFDGTCRKTTSAGAGKANCACVANAQPTSTLVPTVTTPSGNQPTQPPGGGNPSPTQIVQAPSNTPRPTNTSVPVPTNTSVPTDPGLPTNTPVPVPTNTSVPLSTLTPTPTLNAQEELPPNVTSTATNTPNPTATNTSAPQSTATPQQTQLANQTALPKAGNANQNIQFVLAAISLAVLAGAVVLLFFL